MRSKSAAPGASSALPWGASPPRPTGFCKGLGRLEWSRQSGRRSRCSGGRAPEGYLRFRAMDNLSFGILGSALTGGLAGAAFTLTAQWITRFWRKPRIQILFDAKEPGCLIDTNVVGQTGSILRFVR